MPGASAVNTGVPAQLSMAHQAVASARLESASPYRQGRGALASGLLTKNRRLGPDSSAQGTSGTLRCEVEFTRFLIAL